MSTRTKVKTVNKAEQTPQQIDWPEIRQTLPVEIESLLEDQLLLVHNALSTKTCQAWVAFCEKQLQMERAPLAKRGEAQRTSQRFQIHDTNLASRLWNLLGSSIQQYVTTNGLPARGCNSSIRVYRYGPGQFFDKHYDDSVVDGVTAWRSHWTLLIYLTGQEDGVKGGETAFYLDCGKKQQNTEIVAPLNRGTALLHRHGKDCLLHEGRAVKEGFKWVLRSDIMF